MESFIKLCKQDNLGFITENDEIKKRTTLKIGGIFRVYFEPHTINNLIIAVKYIYKHHLKYRIIGNGSNLLISEGYFNEIVINLRNINFISNIGNDRFLIGSGVNGSMLAKKLVKEGYEGIEFLSVIPGNFGGLIWNNAGAYKKSMVDILIKVDYLDNQGLIHTFNKKEIESTFGYRKSPFQNNNTIIISAVIEVKKTNDDNALKKVREYLHIKRITQPINMRNAGSTFKNSNIPSWQIIDQLGYRGYQIGDACVSEKHANFLINLCQARFDDMELLIKLIQNDAKRLMNIDLICEWVIWK